MFNVLSHFLFTNWLFNLINVFYFWQTIPINSLFICLKLTQKKISFFENKIISLLWINHIDNFILIEIFFGYKIPIKPYSIINLTQTFKMTLTFKMTVTFKMTMAFKMTLTFKMLGSEVWLVITSHLNKSWRRTTKLDYIYFV